jgi:hypothetical protein
MRCFFKCWNENSKYYLDEPVFLSFTINFLLIGPVIVVVIIIIIIIIVIIYSLRIVQFSFLGYTAQNMKCSNN